MTRITVLGGTGYGGAAVVAEAARRGHAVTACSRHAPERPVAGVTYETRSLLTPGSSTISADHLALAVLDEVEQPRHSRRRFHAAH